MIEFLRFLELPGIALALTFFATGGYLAARPFRKGATWFGDLARLRAWAAPRLANRLTRWRHKRPRLWRTGHVITTIVHWSLVPGWWLIDSTTVLRGGTPPSQQHLQLDSTVTDRDWDTWAASLTDPDSRPSLEERPDVEHRGGGLRTDHGIAVGADGRAVDPAEQYQLDVARRAEEREWITRDRQAHAELLAQQRRLLELQARTNREAAAFNQHSAARYHRPGPCRSTVVRYLRPISILGLFRLLVGLALIGLFAVGAITQVIGSAFPAPTDGEHQGEVVEVSP
jgi:hypothetical protein